MPVGGDLHWIRHIVGSASRSARSRCAASFQSDTRRRSARPFRNDLNLRAVMCAPLVARKPHLGVIYVDSRAGDGSIHGGATSRACSAPSLVARDPSRTRGCAAAPIRSRISPAEGLLDRAGDRSSTCCRRCRAPSGRGPVAALRSPPRPRAATPTTSCRCPTAASRDDRRRDRPGSAPGAG